jgi:hypothetical protein
LGPPPDCPTPKDRAPDAPRISPSEPPGPSSPSDEKKADTSVVPVSQPEKDKEVVMREATAQDIERIESLTLEDFATDFSKVQIPDRQGPLSDAEMKVAVETLLDSLKLG